MKQITKNQARFVALQFIQQYFQHEKQFIVDYQSNHQVERLRSLQESASYFSVSRNFKKQHDPSEAKHDRLVPVLQILDRIRDKPCDDIVSLVNETESQLSSKYGDKSVLSATTKFLWLSGFHNTRIYDSQAKKALGFNPNQKDYQRFVEEWDKQFSINREIIERVLLEMALEPNLINYLDYDEVSKDELDTILIDEIIIARIFDMYLWQEGSGASSEK